MLCLIIEAKRTAYFQPHRQQATETDRENLRHVGFATNTQTETEVATADGAVTVGGNGRSCFPSWRPNRTEVPTSRNRRYHFSWLEKRLT